ncbi:MAG: WXG100 family type VII secretion target [Actinomycetota bacterium]|nr:WXG100 family type VII secretion target [Actinomycetota bacterium]
MASYQVTPEEMQAGANNVFTTNETVQGQLSSLRNQLAPLAGAWQGQASTAFQTLMQRWDENARRLNEALRAIGEQLQASGTSYAQQEEQQTQSISSISGALE